MTAARIEVTIELPTGERYPAHLNVTGDYDKRADAIDIHETTIDLDMSDLKALVRADGKAQQEYYA